MFDSVKFDCGNSGMQLEKHPDFSTDKDAKPDKITKETGKNRPSLGFRPWTDFQPVEGGFLGNWGVSPTRVDTWKIQRK